MPILVFLLWKPELVRLCDHLRALLPGRDHRLFRRLSRPRAGADFAARPVPRPDRRQDHGRGGDRHAGARAASRAASPIIHSLHIIPALVILLREIIVSGLREFLASLQVSMPVSQLAKWKTTLQLVALGALILGGATAAMAVGPAGRPRQPVGRGGADPGHRLGLSARRPEAYGLSDSHATDRFFD